MPYSTSPTPKSPRSTSTGNDARSSTSKSDSTQETGRMFELFENKAEVKILNSVADDRLAASMYGGGVKKSKRKKSKKQKKGVSGYDFDSLLK